MTTAPRVTVVVPVRDEAARLAGCLARLAQQDLPPGVVEVLVVDGGSTDGTADLARRLLADRPWWRAEVVHSAAGSRPANLNAGLAAASAPVVVRVDARSRVPAAYLRRCAELLEARPEVAVVGGRQRAVAPGTGPFAVGTARALNNRWGTGLARYRRSARSGQADTVYLGAYRTAQLRQAGGWRADLPVNQDFDLNRRLRRFGTVWFDAGLAVDYLPRASLAALLRQYRAFGEGKARYWQLSGDRPRPRQAVLLAVPVMAVGALGAAAALLGFAAAAGLAATAVVALGTVEAVGSDGPSGGLRVHAAATAVLAGVAVAWLAGVATGLVRPARRAPSGPATPRPVRPAT